MRVHGYWWLNAYHCACRELERIDQLPSIAAIGPHKREVCTREQDPIGLLQTWIGRRLLDWPALLRTRSSLIHGHARRHTAWLRRPPTRRAPQIVIAPRAHTSRAAAVDDRAGGRVTLRHCSPAGEYSGATQEEPTIKGYGGATFLELRTDFETGTYRAVYTVRFAGAAYVSSHGERERCPTQDGAG